MKKVPEKHDFQNLISLARKSKPTKDDLVESAKLVEYHIYDVIIPGEELAYVERMQFIEQNIGTSFSMVKVVPSVLVNSAEEVDTKLGEYLESGYEGQMLRERFAPYEHRRSKSLIKHKTFEDEEFEIVEIVEGLGNWAGYAKSITIKLPDGTTQSSGMRGNQNFARQLLVEKDNLIGTDVTVRYQNKTGDGKLRFPVAVKFWKSKRDV